MENRTNKETLSEETLKQGAKDFETFWLRPKKMASKEAIIQMRINKKWGGWKLKDELVEALGLEVGDTINTEVTVLNGPGLIGNADDVDLFASGKGADWLLEKCISKGAIINAKVKFLYSSVPIGRDDRVIWKVSLLFEEGYNIIKESSQEDDINETTDSKTMELLKSLLEN